MDEREKVERALVEKIARSWLETPWHHRARVKGHGVDCAQIIAAVFEEAELVPHIEKDDYSMQWFMHNEGAGEPYIEMVEKYAREIEEKDALAGDIVVYRVAHSFAHGAIIVSPGWPNIVHAYRPAGIVSLANGTMGDLGRRKRRFFSVWRR